jgi:hypothetical protein
MISDKISRFPLFFGAPLVSGVFLTAPEIAF